MSPDEPFPCFMVRKDAEGRVTSAVQWITRDDLPPGDLLIEVAYSSLNYKDALASQGHAGVVQKFPHISGIDCAGTIVESTTYEYGVGEEVLVTGYDLGAPAWGGYSRFVRVPADWVVPLPVGLSVREAMIYGTAGFTAAQCVTAIVDRGIGPQRGLVAVTGATGGVGSIAVAILSKLGYEVVAITGKPGEHSWLKRLGAAKFLGREALNDTSDKPLLAERWAAAVDTVGGQPLATIVRSLGHRGVVAACGLVAGTDLPLTVYPFILRGVSLAGIDSAKCPRPQRLEMWQKLAGPWRFEQLDAITDLVTLDGLPKAIQEILAGEIVGRTLVVPNTTEPRRS